MDTFTTGGARGGITATVALTTSILAFVSGFMLGVYSIRGWMFVSPELAAERRAALGDPTESDESDVDVADSLLDHAPNWTNGEEADRRDGLRQRRGPANTIETGAGEIKGAGTGASSKGAKKSRQQQQQQKPPRKQPRPESDDDEDDDEEPLIDLANTSSSANEECKLVLVVRTDLGMTKGKIAAQCSHATLACYKRLTALSRLPSTNPSAARAADLLRRWERRGQAKIAVQVRSEAELVALQGRARALGVAAETIADAGRTQIDPGSLTVLGVGPAPKSLVDQITGGLKLL